MYCRTVTDDDKFLTFNEGLLCEARLRHSRLIFCDDRRSGWRVFYCADRCRRRNGAYFLKWVGLRLMAFLTVIELLHLGKVIYYGARASETRLQGENLLFLVFSSHIPFRDLKLLPSGKRKAH